MILLDFLLSLTPAAKEKGAQYSHINRGVQYHFTLNAEDVSLSTSGSTWQSLMYIGLGSMGREDKGTDFSKSAAQYYWAAVYEINQHGFD
jgi:hypothetical protein